MVRATFFFLVILLFLLFEMLTLNTCSESTDPNGNGHVDTMEVIIWEFGSPQTVLSSGTSGSWDEAHVGWASVILEDDTLKMWYSASTSDNVVWAIGYAWSLDGINWTRYSGNPVMTKTYSWETYFGRQVVIKDGDLYRMWYHGWTTVAPIVVGYATSIDGITWTKHEDPVMTRNFGSDIKTQIGLWSVIKTGNSLTGWYYWTDENWDPHWTSGKAYIGYATSSDGIGWEDHGTCISPSGSGWEGDFVVTPLVIKSDITLNDTTHISHHMFYLGMNTDTPTPRLGYANSEDGNSWRKHNNPKQKNPIRQGEDLSILSGGIDMSTVICDWPELNDFHIWYTENPPSGSGPSCLNYIKGKLTVVKIPEE